MKHILALFQSATISSNIAYDSFSSLQLEQKRNLLQRAIIHDIALETKNNYLYHLSKHLQKLNSQYVTADMVLNLPNAESGETYTLKDVIILALDYIKAEYDIEDWNDHLSNIAEYLFESHLRKPELFKCLDDMVKYNIGEFTYIDLNKNEEQSPLTDDKLLQSAEEIIQGTPNLKDKLANV